MHNFDALVMTEILPQKQSLIVGIKTVKHGLRR
jgi:hypothetical protein